MLGIEEKAFLASWIFKALKKILVKKNIHCKKKQKQINFGLDSLFNDISRLSDYLMPMLSLNSSGTI